MHHHSWLILYFLVEMGFLHVGQVGLELPTIGDPPTSASQSARFTGVSYRTWLKSFLKKEVHAVIELVPYLEGINSLENILWSPCRTKENFAFLQYFLAFL